MLLLPNGHYVFRQELLSVDEVMGVKGQVFILNARPQTKDGKHGIKLELLIERGAVIMITKWGEVDETVTG